MKRLLVVFVSALSLVPTANVSAARVVADRVVAVVNRGIITQSELNLRTSAVKNNLRSQKVAPPPDDILQKQVLERLVAERLQTDLARQTGLRIDDAQLDKTLERIAQQNKMTREQLFEAVKEQGLTPEEFRAQIRNDITTAKLREREVDGRVTISEAEVDAFLKEQKGVKGSEFNLAHILIQVPEDASAAVQEAKRKKAEEAFKSLKGGLAFNAAAAKYSEAKDALDGGSLGWRSSARLPDQFVKTLAGLEKGQYSDILKSPNGYHIVQLVDTRSADTAQVMTRTRARHILVRITDSVTEDEAKIRIDQVRERLRQDAKFEEIARVYSEDPSASKGGDLGWLSPGDTVPDFERMMDATALNAISEPVRSPFGWHIIQVLERKTEDVGPERERLQAKNELRAKHADELYDEWLRQLRDSAYVDIRL